jgi:lysophospholipase L1-like esterase
VAAGATAVFLGDSYSSGGNGAEGRVRGWPELVGRARDWQTVNLAVAGTGFINPGWTNQPVGSRVSAAIRERPDVVFVAAGHNDSRWSAAATAKAADKVIDRLRRALPDTLLVIVAPIWPNGSPPTRCLDLRDHLQRKAMSVDAIFIDPLAERWFVGSAHRFIGPDGIHPTAAGYRYMAERVLAEMAEAT